MLVWIGLGFATFGFLVGTTCGLSSAELTTTLLGLLFALIGGSIGIFLGKLDNPGRTVTGVALCAFSIFAVTGLYSGIFVRVNDLLSIESRPSASAEAEGRKRTAAKDYLKSNAAPFAAYLLGELKEDRMSLPEACKELQGQADAEANE